MARLIVRITNNPNNSDPSLTPLRTQRGDVVQIVPDNHIFSEAEMFCGHYKIIDMPGVAAEDLRYLVDGVLGVDDEVIALRAVRINEAGLARTEMTEVEARTLTRSR